MIKECETCKLDFNAKRRSQKYCGKACQTISQRRVDRRLCELESCDEAFDAPPASPKVYCSRSCAVVVNNVKSPKRKVEGRCFKCEVPISGSRKYCSMHKHLQQYSGADSRENYIQRWIAGELPGGSSRKLSEIVRDYLLVKAQMSCEGCGFNTRHPSDGKSILEVDHIDGNGENHRPDNLRVLCPNCHALTSTYRGRNKGNGRKVFYMRVVRD